VSLTSRCIDDNDFLNATSPGPVRQGPTFVEQSNAWQLRRAVTPATPVA
jgi:hypothetical protein